MEKGEYVGLRVPLCVCVSPRINGLWRPRYYVKMNGLSYSRLSLVYDFASLRICVSCLLHLGKNYAVLLVFPFLLRGEISLIGKHAADSFQPLMRNSRLLYPSPHYRCSVYKPWEVNFKPLTSID